MTLPTGWPPRGASGRRSIRFYTSGTGTADFADNAFLFVDGAGANTFTPLPYVRPGGANVTVDVSITPSGTGNIDSNFVSGAAPKDMIWSSSIRICNDGSDKDTLEFSFDGINTHGVLYAQESVIFRDRYEAGISVRGFGTLFRIEAW